MFLETTSGLLTEKSEVSRVWEIETHDKVKI